MGKCNCCLWILTITMVLCVTALAIFSLVLAAEVYGWGLTPDRGPSPTEFLAGENNLGRRTPRGQLIFEDNFDTLSLSTWQHAITAGGGGNWEFQMYTNNRSNSYVKHGRLYIRPTLTSDKYGEDFLTSGTLNLYSNSPGNNCTDSAFFGCERHGTPDNPINPIMSARLHTVNSFSFKYGIVHVRAKLPKGDWLWPAIWLLPKTNWYGGWPRSGEIDMMESRGNQDLPNGVGRVGSTLHFGPNPGANGWPFAHFEKTLENGKTFHDDFHVFGLEWTPDFIRFTVDDETIGTVEPDANGGFFKLGQFPANLENPWQVGENPKIAPFDQPFYLIINLAVGGTNGYFPDSDRKPWRNNAPTATRDFWNARSEWLPTWNSSKREEADESAALQVDYVRVWAL